ncbi:MAG: KamA family radical SAM protein [Spirochaetales bacterium]|nr:KamA family radical SAM protein [Spirochaetales bacterium]
MEEQIAKNLTEKEKNLYLRLEELGGNLEEINRVKKKYPMKITSYYLNLIKEKDDPIWLQSIPKKEELEDIFNIEDPLKEEEHTPVPYLVHKYPDRVLLLVSSLCAMYCRFCTRKRKVGKIKQIPMEDIFRAIDYIKNHHEVRDVVVSGGDPFMRPDGDIRTILDEVFSIRHLEIVRIGTRIPCIKPSRITDELIAILASYKPLYMNIHFNHPDEITEEVGLLCGKLADSGIMLGSQTVLLKGVNDSVVVMKELMHKLLGIRVKPYYIFQCDLVKGIDHFRTDIQTGIDIIKNLQGYTSGLCVPHYVIDGPGGKVPVSPQYIKDITPKEVLLGNYLDILYSYPVSKGQTNQIANKKVNRIGLAYNLRKLPGKGERSDKYIEYDEMNTIDAIRQAIMSDNYEVTLLEADELFIERLKDSEVDFVFNIAEGIHGESRESHVPAILEMFNIPYTGSGVLTQAITLNKSRKKEILSYHGIPTPRYQLFKSPNNKLRDDMAFPLIVKPDAEGSSAGITNSSLVHDPESLKKQVAFIFKHYNQNVLVEEFCSGREFTVALLGNKPLVLPIVEIDFSGLPPDLNKIDSYEVKWELEKPENNHKPLICPADIKTKLKNQIEKTAKNTFNVLGCRDFCRIDIRLDSNDVPHILDVNALPGLMPDPGSYSRFTYACYSYGLSYAQVILCIFYSALKRYNLLLPHGKKLYNDLF